MQADRQACHKNASASNLSQFQNVIPKQVRNLFNVEQMLKQVQHDNHCKGFTLAEVLLVITVIGVVASLTIPNLITNIQEKQTTAALKKAYSTLSNATISVAEENGGNLISLPVIGSSSNSLISYYYKYLNVIKQCTYNNTRGNCWHSENASFYLDGTPANNTNWDLVGIGVILGDGTLVSFADMSVNCIMIPYGGSPLNDICTIARVDLNGFKRPNTYGKDMFLFYITKNRVVPNGSQGTWIPAGDCTTAGRGETCAFDQLNE